MRFRSGSDCLAEKRAHADKISFSPVFLHTSICIIHHI